MRVAGSRGPIVTSCEQDDLPRSACRPLPAMICNILNILSLRANGEFTCNHGAGQQINLGWASAAPDWSVTALLENDRYARMRALFRRGVTPWGDTCERCYALRRHEPYSQGARRRLTKISVEPSLACALRCPSCSRAELVKQRPGSVFLPLAKWRRLLASLRDESYDVDLIFMCGHGEPLAHPEIESFVAAVREFLPTTPVVINTNGNYRLAEVFPRGIYPDRFIVSVDGLSQKSYAQYRVHGDVELALQFMSDARHAAGQAPAVEWKYILFAHDDSDEELIAAQQKAAELDLDSLQFVLTQTPEKSRRFTPENIEDLPLVWSRAYPETTPNLYARRPEARAVSPVASDRVPEFSGAGRVRLHIDCCRPWSGRLVLRGWAMSVSGRNPRGLSIQIGDEPSGVAEIGRAREDVLHAFPALGNRTSGFNAVCALPRFQSGSNVQVTLAYLDHDYVTYPFTVDYDLSETSAVLFNQNCP